MPKFGGKTFSPENDFKVTPGDPWKTAGDRGSDKEGWKRGDKFCWNGKDDASFLKPSDTSDDGNKAPSSIAGEVFNHSAAAGTMLTGSGPVKQVRRK